MHPLMSDIDVTIRQFERTREHQAFHRHLLTREVARLNGRLGPLGRLAEHLRTLIDPRGTALARYRRAELARDTTGTMLFRPATPAKRTPVRLVPIANQLPRWRDAA